MTGFAWGVGLAAAGAIFSNCNWGNNEVNINVNKAANIDRNFDRTKVEGGRWQHDGSHRQGVAYRDNATREKYSRDAGGGQRRDDFRGRDNGNGRRADSSDRTRGGDRTGAGDRSNAGNRASVADRSNAGNRASVADRSNTGNRTGAANRSAAGDRGSASNRAGTSDVSRASDRVGGAGGGGIGGGRDNAFQGVGSGGATQRSADRGRSSVQSSGFSRPSGGGGARAGGGGRGGRR